MLLLFINILFCLSKMKITLGGTRCRCAWPQCSFIVVLVLEYLYLGSLRALCITSVPQGFLAFRTFLPRLQPCAHSEQTSDLHCVFVYS